MNFCDSQIKKLVKSLKYTYILMCEGLLYYYLVFCLFFELRNSSFDAHSSVVEECGWFFFLFCKFFDERTTFLRDALIVWER